MKLIRILILAFRDQKNSSIGKSKISFSQLLVLSFGSVIFLMDIFFLTIKTVILDAVF